MLIAFRREIETLSNAIAVAFVVTTTLSCNTDTGPCKRDPLVQQTITVTVNVGQPTSTPPQLQPPQTQPVPPQTQPQPPQTQPLNPPNPDCKVGPPTAFNVALVGKTLSHPIYLPGKQPRRQPVPAMPASFPGNRLCAVELHLIFWGAAWQGGSGADQTAIIKGAQSMVGSDYVKALSTDYGAEIGAGNVVETPVIADSSPNNGFTDQNIFDVLTAQIGKKIQPPKTNQNLYIFMIPGGIQYDGHPEYGGIHGFTTLTVNNQQLGIHYGFVLCPDTDSATLLLGHEVIEAITDPEPPNGVIIGGNEIGDLCETENPRGYRLNDGNNNGAGTLVEKWFSVSANKCVTPNAKP